MGAPTSLLAGARAFARDYPRDQMPAGYLWDVIDFVPAIIDAPLTGRGSWQWGSDVAGTGPFTSGILMPYREGDQLLAASDSTLYQVDTASPYAILATRGATFASLQNPIKYNNVVVHFDAAGAQVPQIWPAAAGALVPVNGAFKFSRVGTTYKTMLVTARATGEEHVVRFSVPGINVDLTAATSYDPNSFIATSLPVTALAGLRSMILVFHAGSIERIRGNTPPHGDVEKGDMFLEDLFDNAGTNHPRSIAYWNDNCVFADEHGVHITDGAVVKSLTSQGGISYFWRLLFDGVVSVTATTFLDYYIITLRHPSTRPPIPFFGGGEEGAALLEPLPTPEPHDGRAPIPPVTPDLPPIRPPDPVPIGTFYNTTLVCDLNKRQWFRFSNMNAISYWSGGGSTGMERVWAGLADQHRLARVGPMFYPNVSVPQVDANGIAVTPRLETAWYRLANEGRKRVRFAYLSYDVRGAGDPVTLGYCTSPELRDYVQAGVLPGTTKYSRYRLPVAKFPYGLAFFVQVTGSTSAVRIYDVAAEAQAAERSRV